MALVEKKKKNNEIKNELFSNGPFVIILIIGVQLLPATKTMEIVCYFEVTFEIFMYNWSLPVVILSRFS